MTISAGNAHRLLRRSAVATVLLSAGIICVSYAADRDPRDAALPGKIPEAIQKVVTYDKAGKKAAQPYRIAYISEGGGNSYANARDKGLDDASKKYGFTVKAFDAHFNPQNQLKDVQNAVQEKFDGYLFAPAADAASCKMWKDFLVPTKKPVVSLDLTMCGDVTYTPGLAATVTMQSQPYYDFHVEQAFAAACEGRNPCKGVSLSGFAGSDLFARWDKAIENGLKKYPNVQMVSRREAKFDARIAEQITQDALQVNRDLAFRGISLRRYVSWSSCRHQGGWACPRQRCQDLQCRCEFARIAADKGWRLQRNHHASAIRGNLLCRGGVDDGARRTAVECLHQSSRLTRCNRWSGDYSDYQGERRQVQA